LASGTKNGYVFTYVRAEGGAGYSLSARPAKAHQTEARYFFTDQSGVIRFAIGQDADNSGALSSKTRRRERLLFSIRGVRGMNLPIGDFSWHNFQQSFPFKLTTIPLKNG